MRLLVIAGVFVLGLALGPVRAQGADEDIQSVIARQIEAFRTDDFAMAFAFASPSIQRMFGNSDRFGEMIRNGYPMVWRPAQVRFTALSIQGGRTVQSVIVTDRSGALYVLDYEMISDDGDEWRINGVTLRRPGDTGA
jgi:hypothetical protein